jgi:hypothetical protein
VVAGGTIGLDQVARPSRPPYMPSTEAAVLTPTKGHVNVVRRCSRAWGPQSDETGHLCSAASMLKTLTILFGLLAALSACAPYPSPGYGYSAPPYSGPVYYGPGYYPPHTSEHGTVQY